MKMTIPILVLLALPCCSKDRPQEAENSERLRRYAPQRAPAPPGKTWDTLIEEELKKRAKMQDGGAVELRPETSAMPPHED